MSAVAQDYLSSPKNVRVLVAEDSSITQDLLKLVLTQRGCDVFLADDGEAALQALTTEYYDVALIDFHLPKLDGVEVVTKTIAEFGDRPTPKFIAITADVEGLLTHKYNCENFDQVVPKPVDIREVCSIIDKLGDTKKLTDSTEQKTVENIAPPAPTTSKIELAPLPEDYEYLKWPDDFTNAKLESTFPPGAHSAFDAVIICAPATLQDISNIWHKQNLHLLPIIDLGGFLQPHADYDADTTSSEKEISSLIQASKVQRAKIHRDILASDDAGDKLLAKIYSSECELTPTHNASGKLLVSYNIALSEHAIIKQAEKLVNLGLLKAQFFDRIHQCKACEGAAFNVREECPACRSSNLTEDTYLHHFPCAYQGAETDFRDGDQLICPKCRQELLHFGHDYDRPGIYLKCNDCAHTTSEPAVGFLCTHCHAHTDGDATTTIDIQRYSLTKDGARYIEAGHGFLGTAKNSLRYADLPLELVVALNTEAKIYNDQGTPFSLLDISYQNQPEIDLEFGPRAFTRARDLFLKNFKQELGTEGRVVKGSAYDFAIMPKTAPDDARASIAELTKSAVSDLRHDPGVAVTIIGPEDLI